MPVFFIVCLIFALIIGNNWLGWHGMVIACVLTYLVFTVQKLKKQITHLQKQISQVEVLDGKPEEKESRQDGFTFQGDKTHSAHEPPDGDGPFDKSMESKKTETPDIFADLSPPPLPSYENNDKQEYRTSREDHLPPLPESGKIQEFLRNFITQGNLVVKIGLVILFFGVAFLLKFASERNMLPVEIRYIAVATGAVMMLVTGWRMREKHRVYSLLLQGGGTGVLYITVFSAAKLHNMIPMGFAFLLMILLVVLSGAISVMLNARLTAFFGAAGGFLAPVLTSTGSGSHVMLFSYYAVLNSGILGIAWFKSWRELNLIGFVFTFGIGGAWGFWEYRSDLFSTTEPFLVLFFIYFAVISILFAFRQPPHLRGYVDGTLVFGLPVTFFTFQSLLVKDMEYGLALSALLLSLFYILIARVLWDNRAEGMRTLTEAFLALGVVFVSLAIPLSLSGRWTAAAWAMEGAALVWVGIRQMRLLARNFGLLLQVGAGVSFLIVIEKSSGSLPVVNGFYLGCFCIAFSSLFSSYYLQYHKIKLRVWERGFHIPMLIWGLIWWYGAGFYEIERHVGFRYEFLWCLLFVGFSALFLSLLYGNLSWPALKIPVFSFIVVLAFFVVVQQIFRYQKHPFQNYGYIAWPFVLSLFYYILWKHENKLQSTWQHWQHRLGFIVTLGIITLEIVWGMKEISGRSGTWDFIAWGAIPGICIMGVLFKGHKLKWPILKHRSDYRSMALVPPLTITGIWFLSGSLLNAGDPWPLKYIPVVNPLEVSLFYVLCVTYIWVRIQNQEHSRISDIVTPYMANVGFVTGLFILMNSMIGRVIHFYCGVPFRWDHMFDSMIFQASISVIWSLLALGTMVVATKKGERGIWFIGASLLAIVVLKLFIIDLSSSGTIARIISFLVTGLLMLVIGFFSPLPPHHGKGIQE